ncbi:MAG: hypothetical protein BZY88_04705 [SAR202 cluster bacterium Io17-Chloro-G9]|nr:MAG: hypothetical protein BZY88_04705 [SAR202 cluster bacterium Io17-Chloro-G9]
MVEIPFKLRLGQEVRELASAASSDEPCRLIVVERGYYEGQPAYVLNDVETGRKRGWFPEDTIEPYHPNSAS